MLKTNSKKACENIRGYICSIYEGGDYGRPVAAVGSPFEEVACSILRTVCAEKGEGFTNFKDWLHGAPAIIDYPVYCGDIRRALQSVLDETDEQAQRFPDERAEELLAWLIYREMNKATSWQIH